MYIYKYLHIRRHYALDLARSLTFHSSKRSGDTKALTGMCLFVGLKY